MASLLERITHVLDNAEALEKLLPEIFSLRFSDIYLGNIFVRTAILGYIESYNLIAREIFKEAEKHHENRNIERALLHAIEQHENWIANDLLQRILRSFNGYERDILLHYGLCLAAQKNNIIIAEHILQEELSIVTLEEPLKIACERNNVKLVALMVESLMTETKKDRETAAIWLMVDESHRDVVNDMHRDRGRVLGNCLQHTVQDKSNSTTEVLLPPFLRCTAHLWNHSWASEILENVSDEEYASISRVSNFFTSISQEWQKKVSTVAFD